jgi:hypothetical protein
MDAKLFMGNPFGRYRPVAQDKRPRILFIGEWHLYAGHAVARCEEGNLHCPTTRFKDACLTIGEGSGPVTVSSCPSLYNPLVISLLNVAGQPLHFPSAFGTTTRGLCDGEIS